MGELEEKAVYVEEMLDQIATQAAIADNVTHQSIIKTTFLLYLAAPTGMMTACDETGAVSIIGRWNPFV